MKKTLLIIILGLVLVSIYELMTNESASPKPGEETESVEVIVSEDVELNTTKHAVNWSDNFGGYETKITHIEFENKKMRVYFELFNGSDVTFNNNVEWGKAVINQKQLDANMFGSEKVGGEHLSNTKHGGYVVYYADSQEDFVDVKEVRLTWTLTNDSTYESKDYDVTIPLN